LRECAASLWMRAASPVINLVLARISSKMFVV
jgi:hypothetical protein